MRYAHKFCGWSKRLKPNESRRAFIRSAWLCFVASTSRSPIGRQINATARWQHVNVDFRFGTRLCENSDGQLACRTSISISSMWESIVLTTSFGRRQLRKQFCACFAQASFHTAWDISVILKVGQSLAVYPQLRTWSCTATADAMCQKWANSETGFARTRFVTIPTPARCIVGPEGRVNERISADPDFRHSSCPPPDQAD